MRWRLLKVCSSIAVLRLSPIINTSEELESNVPGQSVNPNSSDESKDDKKLIGAQVFFRHGARTPLHVIPSDGVHLKEAIWRPEEMLTDVPHTVIPYRLIDLDGNKCDDALGSIEKTYIRRKVPGGASLGQLTCLGQNEMFQLGQRLRKRYVEHFQLLPGTFDRTKVYCRSTLIRRNIVSARCVLAGLFDRESLVDRQEPVPVHVCIDSDEIMYMNRRLCRLLAHNMANNQAHELHPEIKETRRAVAEIIGLKDLMSVTGSKQNTNGEHCPLYFIRDDLVCRMHHGFEVPSEVTSYLEAMDRGSALELGCEYMGDEKNWDKIGLKAGIGCVCQMILDNICDQIDGCKDIQPLLLYSTHDSLLVPLLSALGLFDGLWPTFASSVAIELFQNSDGSHSVQVFYNDKLLREFTLSELMDRLQLFATTEKEYHTICNMFYTSELSNLEKVPSPRKQQPQPIAL